MTMTPEEKLSMARECAAAVDQTACWKIARERVINDATLQDLEHHLHVVTTEATALLAIERMQERVRAETGWQDIASAPKDGSEILGFRDDCGVLLMRWTCLEEFLTERELEGMDETTTFAEGWFYADFVAGGRLEGTELPTHWRPLPVPPAIRETPHAE